MKRTEEYIKWALDGVSRLRTQVTSHPQSNSNFVVLQFHKQGGVDFLTRLNLSTGSPPNKSRPIPSRPRSPEKTQPPPGVGPKAIPDASKAPAHQQPGRPLGPDAKTDGRPPQAKFDSRPFQEMSDSRPRQQIKTESHPNALESNRPVGGNPNRPDLSHLSNGSKS